MADPVISVENLGKKYLLSHRSQGGEGLRHALERSLTAPARWLASRLRGAAAAPATETEEFWALRDVSFSVEPGEVVGIIGRNGAGKSTLLKILSRITEPTLGRVRIRGRVASLLEVGTGFHPELTGRENIFLNGAILGMTRAEIRAKFDEIVAFSEVERFLDTPVKRYSSGMYIRLAFSVAAHLEPEILVIDEVLAVGDAQFQKKCLGKMGEVSAKQGRTVLFVSHNMGAVAALCTKAVVLRQGQVAYPCGPTAGAIEHYLANLGASALIPLRDRTDREGRGDLRLVGFSLHDPEGNPLSHLVSGQPVQFRIHYETAPGKTSGRITGTFSLYAQGRHVSTLSSELTGNEFTGIPPRGTLRCTVNRLPLAEGNYLANLMIRRNGEIEDWIREGVDLKVENGDFFGTGRSVPPTHGGTLIEQEWTIGAD